MEPQLKYKKMMYKNQANSQCKAIRKAKVDLKVKKMMGRSRH